jgi:hypothetical protein
MKQLGEIANLSHASRQCNKKTYFPIPFEVNKTTKLLSNQSKNSKGATKNYIHLGNVIGGELNIS